MSDIFISYDSADKERVRALAGLLESQGWNVWWDQGLGRLDYTNLCPFALVDRSILVLQGPAKAPVLLSIGGSSLEATVPTGRTPLVREHKNITIVICNQEQIDETYCDSQAVYIGVGGFDREGSPVPGDGSTSAWKVTRDAGLEKITIAPSARTR